MGAGHERDLPPDDVVGNRRRETEGEVVPDRTVVAWQRPAS
jgi:hypothetical protein